MIEAIVFDMDGLIFDSERVVQRSWEDAGNKLGLAHVGNHIYNTLGMNVVSRRAYFCRAFGEDFPYDEFAALTRVRFREIVEEEGLGIKPGLKELIMYARKNKYKLGVATSSSQEHAARNLKEAKIYDYFDGFVFGDMVHRAKPDPEIYLKACEILGADPAHSIALEDSPAGIRSSHSAGMYPIMIPDLVQPDDEILSLTFKKYDSLHDVISLLEEEKNGKIQM